MHLPPVSSSNWKPPSLFCCCCISFYWWWKFHHIPQTSVWLQTFGDFPPQASWKKTATWRLEACGSVIGLSLKHCSQSGRVRMTRRSLLWEKFHILWGYETITQSELNMWSACVWAESHFHFLSSSPHWYPSGSFKNHLEIVAAIQQEVWNLKSSYFNQSTIKPLN